MPEKLFDKIKRQINSKLSKRTKNRIERVILLDLLGRYRRRIFNKGLASDRRRIGNYSTSPILVGASSFAANASDVLGNKKKRSKLDWRTVKTRKGNRRLAILPGGYKEVRRISGRRSDKVDLQFKGDLFKSIQLGKANNGDNVLGFVSDKQRVIAESQEKRFNKKIFALSKTEEKAIDKAWIREIDAILRRL